jgi:hypothetical protein
MRWELCLHKDTNPELSGYLYPKGRRNNPNLLAAVDST